MRKYSVCKYIPTYSHSNVIILPTLKIYCTVIRKQLKAVSQ